MDMMTLRQGLLCVFLFILPAAAPAADLKLPALFSDNVVLQSGKQTRIWGRASAGEKITINYGLHSASAVTAENGSWSASLDLSSQGPTPFDININGDKSAVPVAIHNAIAGEVWLASGQSNMYKPVGPGPGMQPNDNWQQVVADSPNPQIRVFTVGMRQTDQPMADCGGKWEIASTQTTAKFTAAGYFFALELNRQLHVPVGIIHSSWGGTRAEPWISTSGFAADKDLEQIAAEETQLLADHPAALKRFNDQVAQWAQANGRNIPAGAAEEANAKPATNDADWKPAAMGSMKLPAGVHWFRNTVNIPESWAGKPLSLALGTLAGFDTVYYDGVRVGGVDANTAERVQSGRNYPVPAQLVKAGPAVIAMRLVNYLPANGGVIAQAWRSVLLSGGAHISYGNWKFKTQAEFPVLDQAAIATYPKLPPDIPPYDAPSRLFNAMINPLIPYSIAGVIWYQGESNADFAPWVMPAHPTNRWYSGDHPDPSPLYRKLLPALINDWRTQWKQRDPAGGTFPFYYCQIANFKKKQAQPSESQWAEVREAQRVTMGTVPHTGMAVLIDIGQERDIHPTDKEDVGVRLARWALADTYGRKIEDSGPLYKSMEIQGRTVRLSFSHLGGGLVAHPLPDTYQPVSYKPDTAPLMKPVAGSQLQGFEVAGADGKFVWAHAVIDGDTVVVSAPSISRPAAVRYAWADNPTCNLYNAANIPASPFRTDDWWPK